MWACFQVSGEEGAAVGTRGQFERGGYRGAFGRPTVWSPGAVWVNYETVSSRVPPVVHHNRHALIWTRPHNSPHHLDIEASGPNRAGKNNTFEQRQVVPLRKDAAVAYYLHFALSEVGEYAGPLTIREGSVKVLSRNARLSELIDNPFRVPDALREHDCRGAGTFLHPVSNNLAAHQDIIHRSSPRSSSELTVRAHLETAPVPLRSAIVNWIDQVALFYKLPRCS